MSDIRQTPEQFVMESLYDVGAMLAGCKLMCDQLNDRPEVDDAVAYELGRLLDLARGNLLSAAENLASIQREAGHD